MSAVANGLVTAELARVDGSICTFFGVHVGLAMQSINMLESSARDICRRWLGWKRSVRSH
jgi:glutaryl-CoA dehydrogenase